MVNSFIKIYDDNGFRYGKISDENLSIYTVGELVQFRNVVERFYDELIGDHFKIKSPKRVSVLAYVFLHFLSQIYIDNNINWSIFGKLTTDENFKNLDKYIPFVERYGYLLKFSFSKVTIITRRYLEDTFAEQCIIKVMRILKNKNFFVPKERIGRGELLLNYSTFNFYYEKEKDFFDNFFGKKFNELKNG